MERHERLQFARKRAGYDSPTDVARQQGWVVPTYLSHENGTRGFRWGDAKKYARLFRVNALWLFDGVGQPKEADTVPVVGYVGAGAVVVPFNDHEPGAGMEEAEAPLGLSDHAVAVIVRGDSMWPAYSEGDLIYYDSELRAPTECLNREAVVRMPDGRMYVKRLSPGSASRRFTLISYNSPPMIDAEVEVAAPVLWIKRRQA